MQKSISGAQEILNRLVAATGANSESALATDLGVSSQAIYDAKKRAKIPDAWVRIIAERFGISADWLFFGRGCMHIAETLPLLDKTMPLLDKTVPLGVSTLSGGYGSRLKEEPALYAGESSGLWDDREYGHGREQAKLAGSRKNTRHAAPVSCTTALLVEESPAYPEAEELTAVPELLASHPAELPKKQSFEELKACDVDIILIPMMEARLSAGCGSLEVSDESHRNYAFRSDFIYRKGNPADMVLMRVSGDSMEPEICDNDVVLLDQSKKEITPGRLYAVGFEDAIYLKRIDRLPGKVILRSTNKAYPPVEKDIQGDCSELFRVIGRVLWCGREYK